MSLTCLVIPDEASIKIKGTLVSFEKLYKHFYLDWVGFTAFFVVPLLTICFFLLLLPYHVICQNVFTGSFGEQVNMAVC